MKILVIILLALGGVIAYGSSKIAPFVFRTEEPDDVQIVIVKSAGFVLAVIAAVIAFVL